jgi:hypothetical protein
LAEIEVVKSEDGDTYRFQVVVREAMSRSDYERLTGGKASPEALVEESFRFLLEREPKESILGAFDLTVIGRYFPEYERAIGQRL